MESGVGLTLEENSADDELELEDNGDCSVLFIVYYVKPIIAYMVELPAQYDCTPVSPPHR